MPGKRPGINIHPKTHIYICVLVKYAYKFLRNSTPFTKNVSGHLSLIFHAAYWTFVSNEKRCISKKLSADIITQPVRRQHLHVVADGRQRRLLNGAQSVTAVFPLLPLTTLQRLIIFHKIIGCGGPADIVCSYTAAMIYSILSPPDYFQWANGV